MDPRSDLVAAGYQIEADAAILNLSPQIEIRATGLTHLIDTCASHNLDPVQILGSIVNEIKTQPSIKAALDTPPSTKCHINVTLQNITFKPNA